MLLFNLKGINQKTGEHMRITYELPMLKLYNKTIADLKDFCAIVWDMELQQITGTVI